MGKRNLLKTAMGIICAAALVISLFSSVAFPRTAFADAGGYAGSTDYGWDSGYDSDSDSTWDSYGGDDDDWWYLGNTDDDDDDWYTGSSSSSSYSTTSSEGDDDDVGAVIGGLFVLIIFCLGVWKLVELIQDAFDSIGSAPSPKKRRTTVTETVDDDSTSKNRKKIPAGARTTSSDELRGFGEYQQKDPGFHPNQLESLVSNVYVKLQQAWSTKDLEPVRPYFDNQLFSQFNNQLAQLTKAGRTNYVDDIAVLECRARGWYEDGDKDYVVMKVKTRITDYTVDDATGKVVGGFKDKESYMEYEYVLCRSADKKTIKKDTDIEAGQCPQCGAPINVAQSAKCTYCGAVVELTEHDWVICEIKGVSQRIR